MDTIIDPFHPPPGTDVRRALARLLRHYARTGSSRCAAAIVSHLEALLAEPGLRDPVERCACLRLLRHWRAIARNGMTASPGAACHLR